jgi:hypothetical protein
MISSYGLPAPQALDIHGKNCAEKWRRFEIAWHNFSLATELDKKDEKIQIATLLTIIGEEAREVFSTFQWSSAEDDRKIAEVLKRFREYCQHDFGRKYCPAYGKQCTKCGKYNHFAAKCKSKQKSHF